MSKFVEVYTILIGWLPAAVQALLLGFLVIFVIFTIIRIVGVILDAIPFL